MYPIYNEMNDSVAISIKSHLLCTALHLVGAHYDTHTHTHKETGQSRNIPQSLNLPYTSSQSATPI